MNIKNIIREEIGDFDWIRDSNPNLTVLQIKTLYPLGFAHFFEVGDKVFLSGILMLKDNEKPNNNNHLILDNHEFEINYVGVMAMNLIVPPEIRSNPLWVSNVDSNVLNLGIISEDDDLLISMPTNKIGY